MKLKIHAPKRAQGVIKCAIHRSGKLGFSKEAINIMELSPEKSVQIATNEENPDDTNLYLIVLENQIEEAYRIIKAGAYYYLNTKRFFDEFDVDYINKRIIYDVIPFDFEGQKMFKLKRREKSRQKN